MKKWLRSIVHRVNANIDGPSYPIQSLYREIVTNGKVTDIGFRLNEKTYVASLQDIHACFDKILNPFRNTMELDRQYLHNVNDIILEYYITSDNNTCSCTMRLMFRRIVVLEVRVAPSDITVSIGSMTVKDNKYLSSVPNSFSHRAHYMLTHLFEPNIEKHISVTKFVSMAPTDKSIVFYSECRSGHILLDYNNTCTVPTKLLYECLDNAVHMFEQLSPSHVELKNTPLLREFYTVDRDRLTCDLHITYHEPADEYSMLLNIRYKEWQVLSIGDNYYLKCEDYNAHKRSESYFGICIMNTQMDDPSVDVLLPHIRDKYYYLKTVFELTKGARFQDISGKSDI